MSVQLIHKLTQLSDHLGFSVRLLLEFAGYRSDCRHAALVPLFPTDERRGCGPGKPLAVRQIPLYAFSCGTREEKALTQHDNSSSPVGRLDWPTIQFMSWLFLFLLTAQAQVERPAHP